MKRRASPVQREPSRRQPTRGIGDRGEIFIEYVIVLGVIGLVAALAFSALGPRIVSNYLGTRAILLSINP